MISSDVTNPQKLEFCENNGLKYFSLGAKINLEDLLSISTAKVEDEIAMQSVSSIYPDKRVASYLKVDHQKYLYPVSGIKSIYIGLSVDNEIFQIGLILDDTCILQVNTIFNKLFKASDILIETHISDDIYSSKIWEANDFEIYFSGISKVVKMYRLKV